MKIKELIQKLQCMDKEHTVVLEIDAECGHLNCKSNIEDVQFKAGNCVLYGQTE